MDAARIGIIDHDVVEISNLPRQTLYKESMVGEPKAECAASVLKEFSRRDAFSSPSHITALPNVPASAASTCARAWT